MLCNALRTFEERRAGCVPVLLSSTRFPAGLPRTEGWFRAAALGSTDITTAPAAAAATSLTATGGGGGAGAGPTLSGGSGSAGAPPSPALGLFGTPTLAAPSGAPRRSNSGTSTPFAVATGGGGGMTCSEFAARLAESMYTAVHYALVFLQTTAPQVCVCVCV
jgi:hypothetical protein